MVKREIHPVAAGEYIVELDQPINAIISCVASEPAVCGACVLGPYKVSLKIMSVPGCAMPKTVTIWME